MKKILAALPLTCLPAWAGACTPSPIVTPEPGTLLLMTPAVAVAWWLHRKRRGK